MGVAYDVFGNGRTALKANLGKYLEGVGFSTNYANTNPTLRIPTSTGPFGVPGVTRTWTDADADFVPDCDLLNPQANGPTTAVHGGGGPDFCGAISNLRFGQNVLTGNYDPDLLNGWGVRPSDWSFGVSVQQQLAARMSIEVSYHRRSFAGFTIQDNLLTAPSDFTPFSVTAPADPRLPGGGGYTISGMYDVVPARFGQIDNLTADSTKYGDWSQVFNGVDFTLTVRQGGLTFQGGTSTGQTLTDACDAVQSLPEWGGNIGAGLQTTPFRASTIGSNATNPVSPYCRVAVGYLTQGRGLISYMVPKIDVQVSSVYQSKPGNPLGAYYSMPNALVAPSLGRNLAGNAPNVTINLIEPGTLYGDRINQIDFRAAKILRFGRYRTTVSMDLFNVLNANPVLTYNQTFVPGGPWLQANSILTGRLAKINAEFTW
jgi:hypothetical protein